MATSTIRSSRLGRNSCSGGSIVRMTTGRPSMASNRPTKSLRCMGSSLARALRRAFSSRARIMACMCSMRSSAKNMCSVRQRPMPSAPNLRAALASRGISALARTPNLPRNSSDHFMNEARTPEDGSASRVLAWPAKTSPVEPSSESQSPSLRVMALPPTVTPTSFLTSLTAMGIGVPGVGLAGETLAGGAVEREPVALLEGDGLAAHGDADFLLDFVDGDGLGAGDAGDAHAAADHGRVTGHAAARREDAFSHFHAVNVVRNGLLADQDDGCFLGGHYRS